MRQAGEPSVEELLESIKRVIAREDRSGAAVATSQPAGAAQVSGDPLVTPAISASLRGSLETLAAASEQTPLSHTPGSVPGAGLEDMVRELLRPALSEWLDRHLPAIVERMVAAELARIAGRG